jgi:uncharacterized integral membrane protein
VGREEEQSVNHLAWELWTLPLLPLFLALALLGPVLAVLSWGWVTI